MEGRAAARSSVLRELVRLVDDQVKFSAEGCSGTVIAALVVDQVEGHWQRMHADALGHPLSEPSHPVD